MPDAMDKKELLLQNLRDAGCNEAQVQSCMLQMQNWRTRDLLPFLVKHKNDLMREIHSRQKEVDCVDYLLYQIETNEF